MVLPWQNMQTRRKAISHKPDKIQRKWEYKSQFYFYHQTDEE